MSNNKKKRAVIFNVEGAVERGNKKGKELGFPTANIPCDSSIPGGIYAGEAVWNGNIYQAALYKEDKKDIVEAHLLDFSGDLYGEKLAVLAHKKVRDVRMFAEREELIAAILKDIADIRKLCSRE
ncbi:MAG: riboflavin kinase [Candidatus Liptonbacteria bacterium]|nr:riboflavin kinase [Candidatus Liptonbacteria bacterium]